MPKYHIDVATYEEQRLVAKVSVEAESKEAAEKLVRRMHGLDEIAWVTDESEATIGEIFINKIEETQP